LGSDKILFVWFLVMFPQHAITSIFKTYSKRTISTQCMTRIGMDAGYITLWIGFLGRKWLVIGRKTRPDKSEWVSNGLVEWELDCMRLAFERW
jgi:hypothetical protein